MTNMAELIEKAVAKKRAVLPMLMMKWEGGRFRPPVKIIMFNQKYQSEFL
jgi:hypothetical protein